jgi:hypothetical protein
MMNYFDVLRRNFLNIDAIKTDDLKIFNETINTDLSQK